VGEHGEQAFNCEAIVVKATPRKSGGCAEKECVLTWGDLASRLKGRRRQRRSEKSAEVVVAGLREGPNEKERRKGMSLGTTLRRIPDAFGRLPDGDGEAVVAGERGEVGMARRQSEVSGQGESLLAQVLSRENMVEAWKHVKANKGSAGVDGLSIDDTEKVLKSTWPAIKAQILDGTYRPQPVRRVEIPKPNGGTRELGIPTVTDRLVQQALLQVLQPLIDPKFSESSHGFRPGRSAHDAVQKARDYAQEGYRCVVDVDLEKFFDTVNHDILMHRLAGHVDDKPVLRLVRHILQAGVMVGGTVVERTQGTPQGGPLSPLLANVLLDEVDKELEKRGHRFARYADDCNVYVRSPKAAERVLGGLRKIYAKLGLKVNETKTAVGSVFGRKFLGYSLRLDNGDKVRLSVASKALETFKQRIRSITGRSNGMSIEQIIAELRKYVPGWKNYFCLARDSSVFNGLDKWIRHRLRAVHLKHWKRGTTAFAKLRELGASKMIAASAASIRQSWWRRSLTKGLHLVLNIAYFDGLGVPKLANASTSRTARCGPA
jgi:RNA-directed DNA polymerase